MSDSAAAAASAVVSASDWIKGIGLSVAASIIGGASKLAIRKSWLLEQSAQQQQQHNANHQHDRVHNEDSNAVPSDFHHDRILPLSSPPPLTASATELAVPSRSARRTLALFYSTKGGYHTAPTGCNEGTGDGRDENGAKRRHGHAEQIHHHDRIAMASIEPGTSSLSPLSSPETTAMAVHKTLWWPLMLRLSGMFGMTILNPLCCVLAMRYASPSILAPFSGLTLVWIVAWSRCLIGEQPTPRQVSAAALIVLGEVVVAVFGDHTNDERVTVDSVVRTANLAMRAVKVWQEIMGLTLCVYILFSAAILPTGTVSIVYCTGHGVVPILG
jgi:EamA-like transporter family